MHSRSQGYNDSMILNMFLWFLFSEVNQLTILSLLFSAYFSRQVFGFQRHVAFIMLHSDDIFLPPVHFTLLLE